MTNQRVSEDRCLRPVQRPRHPLQFCVQPGRHFERDSRPLWAGAFGLGSWRGRFWGRLNYLATDLRDYGIWHLARGRNLDHGCRRCRSCHGRCLLGHKLHELAKIEQALWQATRERSDGGISFGAHRHARDIAASVRSPVAAPLLCSGRTRRRFAPRQNRRPVPSVISMMQARDVGFPPVFCACREGCEKNISVWVDTRSAPSRCVLFPMRPASHSDQKLRRPDKSGGEEVPGRRPILMCYREKRGAIPPPPNPTEQYHDY